MAIAMFGGALVALWMAVRGKSLESGGTRSSSRGA
jgi:hypothetical protein